VSGRSVPRIFDRYRFSQTDISRKEAMAGLVYSGKAFRDLMNSNYYPLANMKKSVAKLKASDDIDLPTLEYGQYHLILNPASNWPQGSAKYWHKEKGRARVDLSTQPNTIPLSKDEPGVIPLTRCDLLDACVRKCFNSEPPIPMKTKIITHEASDAYAHRHEIRLEWTYGKGEDKAPTLLSLTMVCPHRS
jgi:hypothetical protein